MNYKKNLFTILNISLLIFCLSSFGFSTCKSTPDYINVQSGSYNVGNFVFGSSVYVKPDLAVNKLVVEMFFDNDNASCYPNSNVQFKLFPSGESKGGVKSVANSENGGEITKFSFEYNFAYNIETRLVSTFTMDLEGVSESNVLYFKPDGNAPDLKITGFDDTITVKGGTEIMYSYELSDLESGLSSFRVTGGETYLDDFSDGLTNTNSGTYGDNVSSDTAYTFYVEDKLGNSNEKVFLVKVDSTIPDVVDINKIYEFSSGNRYVDFEVSLQDNSFEDNLTPTISADFSSINPNYNSVVGGCEKDYSEVDQYVCKFSEIIVSEIHETTSVSIAFTVSDSIGNEGVLNESTEIFVDSSEPSIGEFYLVNGLGIHNMVSIYDTNVTIYLKASDESFSSNVRVNEEFGQIQFAPPRECKLESNSTLLCEWKMGENIGAYAGFNLESDSFKVTVIDKFGNSQVSNFTVKFDSEAPEVTDFKVIETEDTEDRVIKSGEVIDFRIFIKDDNLMSNDKYFVTGDFSKIDYREGYGNLSGDCHEYNASSYQCDFLGVTMTNGYLKEEVVIYFADAMGNSGTYEHEVEVFKISDEVRQSFSISTLNILNPISREVILESSVRAWYEGGINTKESGIVIINYAFVSCEEKDISPLLLVPGELKMFPDDVVFPESEEDHDFAFRIDLRDHSLRNDLIKKEMTCSMSILKRSSTEIFPPEIVEFKAVVDFFDTKRGNFIEAHAADLLDDIDDALIMGEEFDDYYEIYELVSSVCKVVSGATGVVTVLTEAWDLVSIILHGIPPAKVAATAADRGVNGVDSTLSTYYSDAKGMITKFCNFVTCKNGGTITEALFGQAGFGGDSGLGETFDGLADTVNDIGVSACSVSVDTEGGKKK